VTDEHFSDKPPYGRGLPRREFATGVALAFLSWLLPRGGDVEATTAKPAKPVKPVKVIEPLPGVPQWCRDLGMD